MAPVSSSIYVRYRSRFPERHRHRIQAIAIATGRRAIGKHMPEVAIATRATDFGAQHAVAGVLQVTDMRRVERRVKTWPAGAGIELAVRTEQRQVAQAPVIDDARLVVEQAAAKGRVGHLVEHDAVFLSV